MELTTPKDQVTNQSKIQKRKQSTPRSYRDSFRPLLAFAANCLCLLIMAQAIATHGVMGEETPSLSTRPKALVYRGPAAGPGLSEAVAGLLESSPQKFQVQYVGPNETIGISSQSLSNVDLYAQPGGPDLNDAWKELKPYAPAIRDFVSRGGRYLGFCLGAYLAGHTPGFGLLPSGTDTDAENDQRGAQVKTDKDTIIQVHWRFTTGSNAGQMAEDRWIYFQEGAVIHGIRDTDTSFVLGRYSKTGNVASCLNKYGNGWVGLIGPHPEATEEWFAIEKINTPHGLQYEIGYDLIEATMTGGQNASRMGVSWPVSSSGGGSKMQNPLRKLFRK